MTEAAGAGKPPTTGDDEVDQALGALPPVPERRSGDSGDGGHEADEVDLEAHIESVTAVHQRLQQRLSDLSR